jgi:hypothetical protein
MEPEGFLLRSTTLARHLTPSGATPVQSMP